MTDQERKDRLFLSMQKLESYRVLQNEMGRVMAAFNFRLPGRCWPASR